jgi:pSer/pThr/pTyr-binding forkhead associated (FHA) protein
MTLFLSHCTPDDEFVNQLAHELNAHGYTTWVDHQDMPPGSRWVSHLEQALSTSDAMLLILSESALQSTYVQSEWHVFFELKKPIFPLVIEECQSPLFLRTFHHLDFRQEDRFAEQFNLLLSVLPEPSGDTTNVQTLDDFTADFPGVDSADEWNTYARAIRTNADKLIKRYARPLQPDEIQLILPSAGEILVYSLQPGMTLQIGRRHEAKGYCPDIDFKPFLMSGKISREHAMLRRTARGLQIADIHSTNGTYLGTQRLMPNHFYDVPDNALLFFSTDIPVIVRHRLFS